MQITRPFRGTLVNAAAIAAATLVVAPAPSLAGQPDEVVVTAALTRAEWSHAVSQDLERNLASLVNPPTQHRRVPTGLVSVRFRIGEQGTPHDIEVSQKSGSVALDAIGKRAVTQLRTVPPLPADLGADQVFEANIIVAADRADHERQLAALHQRETRLMAAAGEGTPVLALTVGYDGSAGANQR